MIILSERSYRVPERQNLGFLFENISDNLAHELGSTTTDIQIIHPLSVMIKYPYHQSSHP